MGKKKGKNLRAIFGHKNRQWKNDRLEADSEEALKQGWEQYYFKKDTSGLTNE